MSNKILNLDLSKDPIMPAIVYGRVGDDRLQTVTVNLTRRDEVADLTGYDITFEGTTYNRQTKVFDSNNISSTPEGLKKGTFDYTFPNMAFAVAGKYEQAYFSIVKDGKRDSTAGFEIYVDGNADIDAPEAETIITEYNKLVAELNELQNQAIDEMNRNFSEAQGRISELEVQINDLRNKIDQALTDFENGNFWTKEESFNKEESSANVIYQIIGKEEVELTFSLDLKGKIAGSDTENRNSYKYFNINNGTLPTTITGSELKNTGDWDDYSRVFDVDGKLFTTSAMVADRGVGHAAVWNLLQVVKDTLGNEFFSDQGATSISSQTALIRNRSSSLIASMWGYGSNPTGNKLTIKTLRTSDLVWAYEGYHNKDSVQKLTTVINPASIPYYISEDGIVTQCAFSDASDGSTASMARVDYATLEFKMKISMNEYIKNVIAAYCGEKESGQWVHKADEALGEESDMNEYKEQGTFLIGSNHRTNQPDGIGSAQGWLTVFQAAPTSSVVTQVVLYPTGGPSDSLQPRMFTRNLLNPITNKWSNWKEITKMFASQMQVNAGELDDKMVSPKTLAEWEREQLIKRGKQTVWGENRQVADPASVNFGDLYISDNNQYNPLPNGETYFTIDSTGIATVTKSGMYVVSAMVKRQFRTPITAWHYVSCVVKSASTGTNTTWDFLPFGGTVQNRNRNFAKITLNLNVGDKIWFKSDSNNTTNALQFINIDQFMMERLGD